jgi:branched-chain amino acid transport system ATP-binding protein
MKEKLKSDGAMHAALSIIAAEHRAFDVALATLIDRVHRVQTHGARPDLASLAKGINHLATFMVHFHHPKEDDFLFRAVRARSGEGADLIAKLQEEHAQGPLIYAELLKCLAGTQSAGRSRYEDFALLLESYARSQLDHMRCEDGELIPIARRVLRPTDWIEIERAFAANRDPLFSAMQGDGAGAYARL